MSNNNVTVAIPGTPEWSVWWWNGFDNFQLDIVGFLAVLGEGAIMANAQVSALSRLFYLPRLLPAPQALIRVTRPTTLPSAQAVVTGVTSGNVKDHILHVAHILLGHDHPKLNVRCVEVRKRHYDPKPPSRLGTFLRGTKHQTTKTAGKNTARVKAKATGPLFWVTLIGFLEAFLLMAASIIFGDGMSFLAGVLLSGLSTVVGISNKWTLELSSRPPGVAPPGDVVIRYPNGSYLIVKCDEDVARELYFAPEEINYNIKSQLLYRMLSLLGTIMLMLGVIALANAKLQLQFAWAGAYIIINIAHWIAAALPQRLHWDLSCYEVVEQGIKGGPENSNFTEALFKAIIFTKSTQWVKNGGAAPRTEVWDDWLIDAEEQAKLYHHHIGELQDPIWPPLDPTKAAIFDCPDKNVWEPKTEWAKLNKAHQDAKSEKVILPQKAV